jgi:hypothetical protein
MRTDKHGFALFLGAWAIGMLLSISGVIGQAAKAQTGSAESQARSAKDRPPDDLQRSYRINTYAVAATGGAGRGENIYFYKCWMCHNEYTQSAPGLKGLFDRTSLVSVREIQSRDRAMERICNAGAFCT